jgi:hypothetical protein
MIIHASENIPCFGGNIALTASGPNYGHSPLDGSFTGTLAQSYSFTKATG